METKNPLESLTIRGLLVTLAGFIVAEFGLPVSPGVLADDVINVGGAVITLVGLVTAAVGRWRADKPLSGG